MSLRRISGLAGILSVALGVIPGVMFGEGPGIDPTTSEIVSWAAENQGGLRLILVLLAGQLFAFGIFVVGLYGVLRADKTAGEPWQRLGLTGGIVAGGFWPCST